MTGREDRGRYLLPKRGLYACFVACFCLYLAVEPENLRGFLAVVSDSAPEQREEDDSETVLIAHAALQRSRRRVGTASLHQGGAGVRFTAFARLPLTAMPALSHFPKRDGVSMPMRC